jgi:hypothetical protein
VIARAPIFAQISQGFLAASQAFLRDLCEKVLRTVPSDLQVLTFRELVREDLRFVGELLAKPVTLRMLVSQANQHIR